MIFRIFGTNACVSTFLNSQFSFLDETMAPLDPASKSQVMSRLKDFCSRSVVLVRLPCLEALLGDDARMLSKNTVLRLTPLMVPYFLQVIYHTDVGNGKEKSRKNTTIVEPMQECVPSNGFFDHNLHVVNKRMIHRSVC